MKKKIAVYVIFVQSKQTKKIWRSFDFAMAYQTKKLAQKEIKGLSGPVVTYFVKKFVEA